jgi:hypothetical protein
MTARRPMAPAVSLAPLAVDAAYRRLGIAAALVHAGLDAIRLRRADAVMLLALSTASCNGDDGATEGLEPCGPAGPTVVTDIDETLTTDDLEFVMQLVDGSYDPLARDGGAELVSAYAELGYFVLYLTARSEEMVLGGSGETAIAATERWLSAHGFPLDRARIALAPTNADVAGEPARVYKAATIREMRNAGHVFEYAYGNADTDILAYEDSGIEKSRTFIIGPLAGSGGTVAVAGDGWDAHASEHLPTVDAVCAPGP